MEHSLFAMGAFLILSFRGGDIVARVDISSRVSVLLVLPRAIARNNGVHVLEHRVHCFLVG